MKDQPGPRYSAILRQRGFHGDEVLLAVVDSLAQSCQVFIETGTEAGSTVAYAARMYPHLQCFTCEADPDVCKIARDNLQNHSNVVAYAGMSSDLFGMLHHQFPSRLKEPTLFWLDAHSHGFGCDLAEEVSFILAHWQSAYILIDDFKVPGQPQFGYDTYGDQQVSLEMLPEIEQCWLPAYNGFQLRGWCLIEHGTIPEWTYGTALYDKVWVWQR